MVFPLWNCQVWAYCSYCIQLVGTYNIILLLIQIGVASTVEYAWLVLQSNRCRLTSSSSWFSSFSPEWILVLIVGSCSGTFRSNWSNIHRFIIDFLDFHFSNELTFFVQKLVGLKDLRAYNIRLELHAFLRSIVI